MPLNLLVIRASDLEASRAFYACCLSGEGLEFVQEQHGQGPIHYACEDPENGLVFEIYPASDQFPASTALRLGFRVTNPTDVLSRLRAEKYEVTRSTAEHVIVIDPDGNTVVLTFF